MLLGQLGVLGVYGIESQIIDLLSITDFGLAENHITEVRGSDNTTKLKFTVTENELPERDGFFDFDLNSVTRVSVTLISGQNVITQTSDSNIISYADNELYINLGEFDTFGTFEVVIKIFTTDHTNGIAICYPGYRTSNLVVSLVNAQ